MKQEGKEGRKIAKEVKNPGKQEDSLSKFLDRIREYGYNH